MDINMCHESKQSTRIRAFCPLKWMMTNLSSFDSGLDSPPIQIPFLSTTPVEVNTHGSSTSDWLNDLSEQELEEVLTATYNSTVPTSKLPSTSTCDVALSQWLKSIEDVFDMIEEDERDYENNLGVYNPWSSNYTEFE